VALETISRSIGFLAPAVVVAEAQREMIQQFRVARVIAGGAEVLEGFDQAAAEKLFPQAVDGDAGGERVFGGDQPFRESQAVGGGIGGEFAEQGRDAGLLDGGVLVEPVAADEQVGRALQVGATVIHDRELRRRGAGRGRRRFPRRGRGLRRRGRWRGPSSGRRR
jgi:hypothetical protein